MFFNRNIKHIAAAIATFAISATIFCSPALAMTNNNVQLKFNSNGKFKIVQFTDIQQDKDIDQRTIQLMEKVLDEEKPDFVMVTGDNLTGDCSTPESVSQAVYNIAQPMEKRAINWAVTFGNHDEEAAEKTGLNEEDMLKIYMSYNHNVNQPGVKNITGTGNMNLLIRDSKNKKAAFNLWLLDSGRYAPEEIAGQDFKGYPDWDWLRFDQVRWYYETSEKLEQQYGYKVPSIMFMHIPLWEYRFMWYASVDGRSADNHSYAVTKHSIVGERNEDECPGPFNSGLFAAMLERGDVKGVFVGHDHVNDYVGNYYGILLGYSASTGFDTYGLDGNEKDRLRGARIFNLDENVNGALVETHMVFAKDYGIQ
ncbi:Calcineurin-like phosphoesterase [Desulfotomaculum arcticum]|uniref:Calcineurin-like phosphoesterase n=1 Tax=Desulfotruncus arcticus DSM 17038 TaxID=1121424 RepID=A0A1I2P9J5_9FIRM|nr:metallophosphoesterase family protein [Desulfotruncus arcticus]SFG10121.1 Calcineurin-like phosphoesterase [Desulfotomaculum arcticum] [Desulfotruncus arcticus DSM 17038]